MSAILHDAGTIQGWRQRRGEDPCGVCDSPCRGMGPIRCKLAPDHETVHRDGAFFWDNEATGAKAEDVPRP